MFQLAFTAMREELGKFVSRRRLDRVSCQEPPDESTDELLGGSNRIASTSLDNGSSDPTAETLLTKSYR